MCAIHRLVHLNSGDLCCDFFFQYKVLFINAGNDQYRYIVVKSLVNHARRGDRGKHYFYGQYIDNYICN